MDVRLSNIPIILINYHSLSLNDKDFISELVAVSFSVSALRSFFPTPLIFSRLSNGASIITLKMVPAMKEKIRYETAL